MKREGERERKEEQNRREKEKGIHRERERERSERGLFILFKNLANSKWKLNRSMCCVCVRVCVCVCVACVWVVHVCALLFVCSQALVRVQRLLQLDAISRGCHSALPWPALLSHPSAALPYPPSLFSHNTQRSIPLLAFSLLFSSLTFLSFSPSLSLVIFLNGFWRKIYACLLQFSSKSMHVCMCQCVFACLCMCVCTCVCVRVCAPLSALCQ